jgi:HEXXH motif-containing protein
MSTVQTAVGRGLVLPSEAADENRALARAYARHLAFCYQKFLTVESHLPLDLRPAHQRIAALLREVRAKSQGAMLSCFASPMVGTPLQCVELRERMEMFRTRIDEAAAEMMPHLLLEMALRRLIPAGQSILWEHGASRLASLALGGELVPPAGTTGWRFSASHLSALGKGVEMAQLPIHPPGTRRLDAEGHGFRLERRFWPVGRVSHLATVDHNPIAAFETHPNKTGNLIDLGGRSEGEWTAILAASFALVERFMPGEFAEMAMMLQEIIPVGYDDVRHLSASYREAIGTIYLTLHPNLMTMTEAIIHEFQHNKLNVSSYSAAYLSNPFHPLYRSPVRPDPRPLWGILLAVHAFLPVAELYRRMRDGGHSLAAHPGFERRMSEIDLKNHEGMEMLRAHASFTPAGRALFDELEALEDRHLAERTARGLPNTPSEIHLA